MKINYSFLLLIIISLYIDCFTQLLIFISALFFHELGHVIVCLLFNIKINGFYLGVFGGKLILNNDFYILSKYKKIIIYLSGILVNFLLYYLFKNTLFSYCNLILFLFNILPIYPLDGYNIIDVIISKKSLNNISVLFICLLFIYGYYNDYYSLVIIDIYLIFKNLFDNTKKDEKILLNIIRNMI